MPLRHFFPALVLLFLMFSLSACIVTNKPLTSTQQLNTETQLIEMVKGPCYNRCPVFTLTIYESGVVTYQGERFTNRTGLWSKNLSKEELKDIVQAFKAADIWRFYDQYRYQDAQQPTVAITYYEDGDIKTVTGKDGRPPSILQLEKQLDLIANSSLETWTLLDAPKTGLPAGVIANQVAVQLKRGVDVTRFTQRYQQQNLKVMRILNPDASFYLMTFNESTIAPAEMLNRLKGDEKVISAEFNRSVF